MPITVTCQRRDPKLRLIISAMRPTICNNRLDTGTINVNDVAQIICKLQPKNGTRYCELRVALKKKETAKNLAVSVIISTGEYKKQFSCADEWVDVTVLEHCYSTCSYYSKTGDHNESMHSYNIIIDVTASGTMPLSSVVNNQLYEDTEFTDFQLHTADGTVAVHKAMLAIHGKMLKEMLRGEWKETKESRINIEGASVQTLQSLKEYMYLGTLPDEGVEVESLLIIATHYLMEKLEQECINKLIKTLTPEKFDNLIEFACRKNIPKLMRFLVLRIPDDIVTEIHNLKINEETSANDKEIHNLKINEETSVNDKK